MVRPIWLCTCFSKDQAPLVDDLLLTKLICLNTMENVCSFKNCRHCPQIQWLIAQNDAADVLITLQSTYLTFDKGFPPILDLVMTVANALALHLTIRQRLLHFRQFRQWMKYFNKYLIRSRASHTFPSNQRRQFLDEMICVFLANSNYS